MASTKPLLPSALEVGPVQGCFRLEQGTFEKWLVEVKLRKCFRVL